MSKYDSWRLIIFTSSMVVTPNFEFKEHGIFYSPSAGYYNDTKYLSSISLGEH